MLISLLYTFLSYHLHLYILTAAHTVMHTLALHHSNVYVVPTCTGSTGALADTVISMGNQDTVLLYSNTLTLVNTDLLVTSGILSVSAIHSTTMKTTTQTAGMLLLVVLLASVFLMVQCCEYIHLY